MMNDEENYEYEEWSMEKLKEISDNLAKILNCKNRAEMFKKFDNNEFHNLDIELTISAYKHLLGE